MRILELEQKFQSEETLNEVLEELKEDFEKVDYYAGNMKNNLTDNPEEAIKTLNALSGTFSNLRTALSLAETEKKNREIRKYTSLKMEIENAGKKFISSSVEKEASEYVASYRRIKNIIRGYKESAQVSISSLQSLLKYMTAERTTKQG